MSPLPSLSCAQAHDMLIELAFEELSPELAAEVRLHAASCNKCQPAWEQMQQVLAVTAELPLAEPPDALSERVMEAARTALEKRAAEGRKLPVTPQKAGAPLAASWWSRLSSWALSPQVAMASVLLLMVGMGLYALPLGRDSTQLSLEAIPEETSPSEAPVASAARVPLEAKDVAEGEASARSEELGSARKQSPRGRDTETSKLPPSAAVRNVRPAPPAEQARKAAATSGAARSEVSEQLAAPAATPKRSVAGGGLGDAALAKQEAQQEESKQADVLAEGMANVKRGAYAQAISLLLQVAKQGTPAERQTAHLWLGRSYRGQGNYARAVSYYELVLASNRPSSEVLGEAAESYERLGNVARAGELRARMQNGM